LSHCIVEKFKYYTELTNEEEELLAKLEDNKETFKAGETIENKGDKSEYLYTMYSGWGYISSTIYRKIRSIFDIKIEADFVGMSELSFNEKLYDFVALTDVTVCPFPQKHLDEIIESSDNLRNVFFLIISREQAIMYERIISLSRRTAVEKVAHFLCEVSLRMGMIGGRPDLKFQFPIRQNDIADILGLSTVHVSRSMTTLKNNKYIDYNRSELEILDIEKLLNVACFDKSFLIDPKKHLAENL
jgi:CRP-like cAMP-binding protein